jgi:signal transduction histidine kinase
VAWRYFGFDDETVNQLLAASLLYVGEAAHALEIKLDQQADLLEVMEKANEALSRLSSQLGPHLRAMADGQPPPEPAASAGSDEQRRIQDQAVVNTLEAVVHEIRNPLMSVGGFARRLARQLQGSGQVEKYAQVILSEAARLDQVLGEMNTLLSPYQPKMRHMELVSTIKEVAAELATEQASEANCPPRPEIRWHLPPQDLGLTGDPQGLAEACRQLIAYAVHLLRQSNVCGALQVHLQVKDQEAVLTLFGPGQPPDPDRDAMAEKAFGPELALAKARRIVEAHRGRLFTAPSPKGDGFVITAHLPRLARAA